MYGTVKPIFITFADYPKDISTSKDSRMTFHPVHEIPLLREWFHENPNPSDKKLTKYTNKLNAGHTRQERPKLTIAKLKIWWKNERQREKKMTMTSNVNKNTIISKSQKKRNTKSKHKLLGKATDVLRTSKDKDRVNDKQLRTSSARKPILPLQHPSTASCSNTYLSGSTPTISSSSSEVEQKSQTLSSCTSTELQTCTATSSNASLGTEEKQAVTNSQNATVLLPYSDARTSEAVSLGIYTDIHTEIHSPE